MPPYDAGDIEGLFNGFPACVAFLLMPFNTGAHFRIMGLAGCEKKLAVGTHPVGTLQGCRAFAGTTATNV
jgi:hypothetical protein